MITDVQDQFTSGCGRCARFGTPDCATRVWAQGIATQRDLCRGAGLDEVAKWGHPCYMHAGGNVAFIGALIGATRGGLRLTLFGAGLQSDPPLQQSGQSSQTADTVIITDTAQLADLAPRIASLLAEAKANAAGRRRAPRKVADVVPPDELVDALDNDPELARTFATLTPGRQRSHVIALTSTADPATRRARILRARNRVLAGKGANEREEKVENPRHAP